MRAAVKKKASRHRVRVRRGGGGDPPAPQSSIAAATKRRLAGGDRRTACPTKKSSRRARRSRSCNTADGRIRDRICESIIFIIFLPSMRPGKKFRLPVHLQSQLSSPFVLGPGNPSEGPGS